jgi:predicted metal-dependent peptidase
MDEERLITYLKLKGMRVIPWLSPLITKVDVVFVEDLQKKSALGYTDGKRVYIDKDLDKHEQVFVFLHEVMHIFLKHVWIMRNLMALKNSLIYNAVADVYINNFLKHAVQSMPRPSARYVTIPKDTLFSLSVFGDIGKQADTMLLVEHLSIDEVYNFLLRHLAKDVSFIKHYLYEGDVEWKGEGDQNEADDDIKDAIERAKYEAQVAKRRGAIPAGLEEYIDAMLPQKKIDWLRYLKTYIASRIKRERDWKRLHKKTLTLRRTPIIPGWRKKSSRTYRLLVAIDASGSITENELREFFGFVVDKAQRGLIDGEVVTFDTKVQHILKMSELKKQHIKVVGRGGTSYEDVFNYARKRRYKDVVIFTDGYGDQEDVAPLMKRHNVIWITSGNKDFPHGVVLEV